MNGGGPKAAAGWTQPERLDDEGNQQPCSCARRPLLGWLDLRLEDLADNRSTWRRADLVVATAALLPPQSAPTAEATRRTDRPPG